MHIRILTLLMGYIMIGGSIFPAIASSPFANGCWVTQNKWCGWDGTKNQFEYSIYSKPCDGSYDNYEGEVGECSWDQACQNISVDACGCTSSSSCPNEKARLQKEKK